jgi:hypothetical protein
MSRILEERRVDGRVAVVISARQRQITDPRLVDSDLVRAGLAIEMRGRGCSADSSLRRNCARQICAIRSQRGDQSKVNRIGGDLKILSARPSDGSIYRE